MGANICYPYPVVTTSTLKKLAFSEAMNHINDGAAFVDLRDVASYLDVHVPGSLSLLYETGPGFQSRARDCIPLSVPLLLIDIEGVEMVNAASSLRGRGFNVVATVPDAVNEWSKWYGTPASTELYRGPHPRHSLVLDVSDPGVSGVENATSISIEQLWGRVEELKDEPRVVIASGYGVRAALAVGILERAGVKDVIVWDTRGQA
jgi:rhodanese-related sulfurtransferase